MTTYTLSNEPAFADLERHAKSELSDRFHIDALLEQGPRSLVYRAFQTAGSAPIALKVLPKTQEGHFLEATAAASTMDHPHIVAVQESGATAHLLWYTMPLLEAPSLDRLLAEQGPLDFKRCLRIVEQIASALQYGHRRGMPHGGLKPENVFVNDAGWTLIADFGIPGALERTPENATPDRLLAYAAPEVLEKGNPIPASDQYSLAVLIHECLTGNVPTSPNESRQSGHGASRPEIPLPVMHALRRAMAPTPQERFPTVLNLVAALDGTRAPALSNFAPSPNRKSEPRVLTMEPESRVRRRITWGIVLVLGGVLAFAWPSIWESPLLQGFRDRFDHWYEADAPAAMASGGSRQNDSQLTPNGPSAPGGGGLQESAGDAKPTSTPRLNPPRPKLAGRAPARTNAPRPAARVATPPTVQPPEPAPVEPGRLLVSSTPWGILYVDGRPVGNTPLKDVPIAPGTHTIRITHEGYEPFEGAIDVTPGKDLRLTGIVLREARR